MLAAAGYDVASVAEQRLAGSLDRDLIEHCRAERRCLITLDLDFANPLVFRPSHYAGIAVLRIPPKASAADLLRLIETLADALKAEELAGKLWIVEIGRIRTTRKRTRRIRQLEKDRSGEETASGDFVSRAERAFRRVARKVRSESHTLGLPALGLAGSKAARRTSRTLTFGFREAPSVAGTTPAATGKACPQTRRPIKRWTGFNANAIHIGSGWQVRGRAASVRLEGRMRPLPNQESHE